MKRVLELIISLIATAATYALMHVVLFMDLFKFQHKLPVYVPTVIAVIVGLIFYFLLATPLAGLLLKRLNQTEERLSKMNLKELSLSVIGCIVGLVLANLIGMAFNGFGALGTFIVVLLNILFGILGIRVARRKKDDVNVRTLKEVLMTTPPSTAEDSIYGRPKILDTSVIIDGRILDLLQTGSGGAAPYCGFCGQPEASKRAQRSGYSERNSEAAGSSCRNSELSSRSADGGGFHAAENGGQHGCLRGDE